MARNRKTITDYLAETDDSGDDPWLDETLSDPPAMRDEPADLEAWDEPTI